MSRHIQGYAFQWGKVSCDLGGFTEVIQKGALDGVLEKSDVFGLLDHLQVKGILSRSTNLKGTLKLTVDNKGLKYSFDAPNSTLGDEVIESLKRGDLRSSSFSFQVSDGQIWEEKPDGTFLRTVTKFDGFYDVSCVYRPAYADSSCELI